MNALTVVSLVAAIAVASASEPILRGPSGIITAHGPIGPEGLDFGEKHGARPILEGPSGIITSAGPIGPSEMQGLRGGFKDNKGGEDGSDGRGILKGPSGIITARGPIGSSGEMAGHRGKGAAAIVLDFEGRLGHGLRLDDLKLRLDEARLGLAGLKGLEGSRGSEKSDSEGQYKEDLTEKLYDDGSWKMEDESRLIAPKMFAPKYIAPAMLQRVFRLEHSNLHLNEGRLGLSGLKFKGLGGSEGSEGQYKKDLNEKLYDDGSYKPELRLNDGHNGLAVGRFGLSGFDLKSLEGSKGPEVSEKSDSEGQYKEDLTEKLFDDGSYKPESRLIAPKIFAPKYIAPAMLQGGFRFDHLNLRLDKGRLGLSGLKFKGVEGLEGSEGQYKEDLNEKLYDDGSYKAELRLNVNDGRNGLTDARLGQLHGRYGFADGRLGLSGFDLKGLEGSRRSEESGKSDSEGQYKEDLNEKLYDDGSYKPELPLNDGRNGLAAARLVLLDGRHGMADGRFGMFHGRNAFAGLELRGFKGFEGSERSDGSEGSDEGQYKPDLTEKLYDDGSYKPELGNH